MPFRIVSAATIFSITLFAQAGPSSSQSKSESGKESIQARKLLKEIKANSDQIRSSALKLEQLSMESNAQWSDYDRQWNMIKPAQERVARAMERLEGMQASLSPAEREAVDQTKRDVNEVTTATHDLWTRLGQQTVDLKAPALRADARRLDKAARELIKETVSAS